MIEWRRAYLYALIRTTPLIVVNEEPSLSICPNMFLLWSFVNTFEGFSRLECLIEFKYEIRCYWIVITFKIILCLIKLRHFFARAFPAYITHTLAHSVFILWKCQQSLANVFSFTLGLHHSSHIIGFRHRIKLLKCKTAVFPNDDFENIAQLFDDNNIEWLNQQVTTCAPQLPRHK